MLVIYFNFLWYVRPKNVVSIGRCIALIIASYSHLHIELFYKEWSPVSANKNKNFIIDQGANSGILYQANCPYKYDLLSYKYLNLPPGYICHFVSVSMTSE